jgi:arylsulfatase A-like enzyme
VDAVGDQASNTLFIYLSDNGLMQGIHRLLGKAMPYRAAHEVPLFMRWDGVIEPGSVTDRVTPNIDVTATIAEAAGVSWPMDGRSALSSGRRGVVLEATASERRPGYCGWRSKRYLYARYSGGEERELYDYWTDPAELNNLAGKRKYRDVEARLDKKTEQNCQPLPPDFSWD